MISVVNFLMVLIVFTDNVIRSKTSSRFCLLVPPPPKKKQSKQKKQKNQTIQKKDPQRAKTKMNKKKIQHQRLKILNDKTYTKEKNYNKKRENKTATHHRKV